MYIYNYRIYDRYKKPVVSLAILADEKEAWESVRTEYINVDSQQY
jgi:hypothetical protein